MDEEKRMLREALEWYAEMAKTMRRATLDVDNKAALHVMKELALDGGAKGRKALEPHGNY